MIHELKTLKAHFVPVAANDKRVELRKDDRGFAVGDTLKLIEITEDIAPTGKSCLRIVTHILKGPCYGLEEGWSLLSIRPLHTVEKIKSA